MAEKVGYFSVKSIGLSRVNGRKPCTLLDAARHNLREIQAELGSGGRIDPSRTHCNAVVHGPPSAAEVEVLARVLLSAAGINASKLRSDHCQAIEAMFSLSPDKLIHDRRAYFAQCLKWVAGAMSIPVLSAVIHRDEAAEHLHVLLLPVKDGAHVGCKLIERAPLMRLRENFFSKVAGPAGFKRGGAKMQGIVKQWAITAVLNRCEALGLPDANGALWPITVAAIERDPTAAVLALGINVNTIRPTDNPAQMGCTQNPIGIADSSQNPIGIKKEGQKMRTLSCVGFAKSNSAEATLESAARPQPELAIETLLELWECTESPRVSRRLNTLRGLSHEEDKQVLA